MTVNFKVLDHYSHHLDVLSEYARLREGPFGRVKGIASEQDLRQAHGDDRLGPIDGHTDFPEKYLVISTRSN